MMSLSLQHGQVSKLNLDTKPGLPEYLKARKQHVRGTLYKDAKAKFERMKTYFNEASNSPIASPLVVAPKATPPLIRLSGAYRTVNPYITIPQKPVPHVQQAIAKATGFKILVDLDVTFLPDPDSSRKLQPTISIHNLGSLPPQILTRRCMTRFRHYSVDCPSRFL